MVPDHGVGTTSCGHWPDQDQYQSDDQWADFRLATPLLEADRSSVIITQNPMITMGWPRKYQTAQCVSIFFKKIAFSSTVEKCFIGSQAAFQSYRLHFTPPLFSIWKTRTPLWTANFYKCHTNLSAISEFPIFFCLDFNSEMRIMIILQHGWISGSDSPVQVHLARSMFSPANQWWLWLQMGTPLFWNQLVWPST